MGQLFVERRTNNQHARSSNTRTRTAPSSSTISLPFTDERTHGDTSRAYDIRHKNTGEERKVTPQKDIPTNAAELEREWKRYCGPPTDTLSYLTMPLSTISCPSANDHSSTEYLDYGFTERLRIVPEQISQSICRVEMDANIFGDILEALHYLLSSFAHRSGRTIRINHVDNDKEETFIDNRKPKQFVNIRDEARSFTYRWMVALPQSGRFHINIAFLSKKQQAFVTSIFHHLQEDETSFTQEGLQHLKKQYE